MKKQDFTMRLYEKEKFDEILEQFLPTLQKSYDLQSTMDRRNKEKFRRITLELLYKGVKKCRKEARKQRRKERRENRRARLRALFKKDKV